jgi:hypothetical protein
MANLFDFGSSKLNVKQIYHKNLWGKIFFLFAIAGTIDGFAN